MRIPLGGDRILRQHESAVQFRGFDAPKTGNTTGLAVLVALRRTLLQKSIKVGLEISGSLNLDGWVGRVHNAVNAAELAIIKGTSALLAPVTAWKQLNDSPDDHITKVDLLYFTDAGKALQKVIVD